jgi:hypothetical protein
MKYLLKYHLKLLFLLEAIFSVFQQNKTKLHQNNTQTSHPATLPFKLNADRKTQHGPI